MTFAIAVIALQLLQAICWIGYTRRDWRTWWRRRRTTTRMIERTTQPLPAEYTNARTTRVIRAR